MKTKIIQILFLLGGGFLLPLTAMAAKPNVTVAIKAEKEIVIKENGQEVRKIVSATETLSGEIITYTLSYINNGDASATSVVLNDPIPTGTTYVFGSATETGVDLAFSIDKGRSFKKPSMLTYEMPLPNGGKEKRVASPEQYTDIRWTIATIPPGGKGFVTFKVKVK